MASLDKTSVRAEVNRLKTDFAQLCSEGNITAESKALMMSMFMIVELILSIFLERATSNRRRRQRMRAGYLRFMPIGINLLAPENSD